MFELLDMPAQNAVIKVIGVGGGGGNAVEHMLSSEMAGVEFIVANTDAQALKNASARTVFQLGADVTRGLGAGANPEVGQQAAMEDRERIMELLDGADMVFITSGMGGGTGTGAAPVIAQVARKMNILTVAVVTRPFKFEGVKRSETADRGIQELQQCVDSLIVIPNEKLMPVLGRDISLLDAFRAANGVLFNAVQGISELITRPGLINVDFADVATVMQEMGMAMMGTGRAKGEARAQKAAREAISSPLIEDIELSDAQGILVNLTAGYDLTIGELEEMGEVIKEFASARATVVVGSVIDPELQDEVRVTVIATGVKNKTEEIIAEPKIEIKTKAPVSEEPPTEILENINVTNIRKKIAKQSESFHAERERMREPVPTAPVSTAMNMNSARSKGPNSADYLDIPAFLRKQAD
ncbi:MAG: cell division protein FtsZ [Pseudomonadota bacterium]